MNHVKILQGGVIMQQNISKLIKEQIEYYRKRASEYDEWFLRLCRLQIDLF